MTNFLPICIKDVLWSNAKTLRANPCVGGKYMLYVFTRDNELNPNETLDAFPIVQKFVTARLLEDVSYLEVKYIMWLFCNYRPWVDSAVGKQLTTYFEQNNLGPEYTLTTREFSEGFQYLFQPTTTELLC